jgi:hypothetical protein
MHDLASAYSSGREFAALAAEAEREWLPELQRLRSRLRILLRATDQAPAGQLQLREHAERIHALLAEWNAKIARQRESDAYRSAQAALAEQRWQDLQAALESVFTYLAPAPDRTVVHVPLDLAPTRRRPTHAHLLPQEAADLVERARTEGLEPDSGNAPWEADFPSLEGASRAEALSAPVWLFAPASAVAGAVMADRRDPDRLRLFGQRIRAAWQVGIASQVEDETWLAQDQPFETYRQELVSELQRRGIAAIWTSPTSA